MVGRLGAWLRAPGNAQLVTAEAANALKGVLEVVRDEDVRAVAEDAIRRRIAGVDLAPGLGRLLGQVVADGAHRPLVELVAQRTAHWLRENPDTVIGVIQQQAPTWSPAFVDRALARRIHAELVRIPPPLLPTRSIRCGSRWTATWSASRATCSTTPRPGCASRRW